MRYNTFMNGPFFFFLGRTMWHAGSYFPDQDQTSGPSNGGTESLPLDHQGSPVHGL